MLVRSIGLFAVFTSVSSAALALPQRALDAIRNAGSPSSPLPTPSNPEQPEKAADGSTPAVLLEGWISDEDYPLDAAAKEESGTTVARYLINEAGQVDICEVAGSSGSASLDWQSCNLVKSRFKFTPAKNPKGRVVVQYRVQRIRWQLPGIIGTSESEPLKSYNATVLITVNPEGVVTQCSATGMPDSKATDRFCLGSRRYVPFVDKGGRNVTRYLKFNNVLVISDSPFSAPSVEAK
jgi:TonB family protein